MHHVSQAHVERSGHGPQTSVPYILTTPPPPPLSLSLSLYLSGSPPSLRSHPSPAPPISGDPHDNHTSQAKRKRKTPRARRVQHGVRHSLPTNGCSGICRRRVRGAWAVPCPGSDFCNQTAARGPDFTPCHVREDGLGAWRLLSRNQVSDHTERHRDGREVGEGRREERVSWEVARKLKTPHVWREEGGTERERKEIVLRFSITNGDTHTHTRTHTHAHRRNARWVVPRPQRDFSTGRGSPVDAAH